MAKPYPGVVIIKPSRPRSETDPRRAAGVRAERQMAHYLDRHFADHRSVHVLHDVRIEFEGDRAQMDHVVLHPYGAAIVESKSVSTSVRINAAGEWERSWSGRWQGMPDPVLQGERQGLLLKRLLSSKEADLLDKLAFGLLQGTFGFMAIDAFAAISDEGTIKRAARGQAPRALKADAVPNAVLETIAGYRKANSVLNLNFKRQLEAPRDFSKEEVLRVAHFLRTRHVDDDAPVDVGEPLPSPTPLVTAPPNPGDAGTTGQARLVCKHCGGIDLDARIGKYGPYGKCRACEKNTSVRRDCPSCAADMRYERGAGGFVGTCGSCGRTASVLVGGA
jgi:hypothetical protein